MAMYILYIYLFIYLWSHICIPPFPTQMIKQGYNFACEDTRFSSWTCEITGSHVDSPGLSTLGSFVTFHHVMIPLYNATNCNMHAYTDVLVPLLLGGPHHNKLFTCTHKIPSPSNILFQDIPPAFFWRTLFAYVIRTGTSLLADAIIPATNRFEVPAVSAPTHLLWQGYTSLPRYFLHMTFSFLSWLLKVAQIAGQIACCKQSCNR